MSQILEYQSTMEYSDYISSLKNFFFGVKLYIFFLFGLDFNVDISFYGYIYSTRLPYTFPPELQRPLHMVKRDS